MDINTIKFDKEAKAKQPEYGTEEYKNQVETIKMRLDDVKDLIEKDQKLIGQVLMMFIFDMEYHRAAICQAEKEWKRDNLV